MHIEMNTLTPPIFLQLYYSVGWEPPCIEQVAVALQYTLSSFTSYDGDKPVGMVRLLGDGGMSFYLKDFVVLPEYQNKGTGSALLVAAEDYIRQSVAQGWTVSLELISTKETVAFYKKQGFEECPCDWDGPGMFKMLR